MKVVFVVGPTASGKSARALRWALKYQGVIVNCDSIQCYQSLDIGSAKPSLAERTLLPHFLFDYVPEGQELTAGVYSRDFWRVLKELEQNQTQIVFVVGGTGFYFQALEKGMYQVTSADPDLIQALEQQLAKEGPQRLWDELQIRDPESAQKISLRDHYRLVRAVEMMRTSGKTPSQIRLEFEMSQRPFPYPLLKLGIQASRSDLEPGVRQRTQKMLELGFIQEVESLHKKGLQAWAPLSSVGYYEVGEYLLGRSPAKNLAELSQLIETSTLQLAKKQRTWFQRDNATQWLKFAAVEGDGDSWIESFLQKT